MRFATIVHEGGTRAAAVVNDGFVLLPATDVGALLRQPEWRAAADAAVGAGLGVERVADAERVAVVPQPRKVICCGHNYVGHILELGHALPSYPTLFTKWADTLTGPTDDLTVPADFRRIDWEAELVAVVGRRAHRATRDEAAEAIAGYTVANDVSLRDWQSHTSQWLPGKAVDRTTPLGPDLVTADAIDPKAGLEVRCRINGELVQQASTADLLFDGAAVIAYASQFTALEPGDLILTGTPGGVGMARTPPWFLRDGDEVETSIDGIGTLRNRIRVAVPVALSTP